MNDYTPIIRNLPLIASVRENQPPGTFVINITADDEDMGYNAAIEIFIDDMVGLPLGYTVVYLIPTFFNLKDTLICSLSIFYLTFDTRINTIPSLLGCK